MPLAGFILLVSGETTFSLIRHRFGKQGACRSPRNGWREHLSEHAGLCCAFLSMVIFSITLNDRLADFLFAATALISILATLRRKNRLALRGR